MSPLKSSEAKVLMAQMIRAYKPSQKIYRIEIKIKPVDMLSWLSLQKQGTKVYGANQTDTISIAGIGEALSVHGPKINSYQTIFKKLRSHLNPQYPYLQWYGGFCFDDQHLDEDWKNFEAYHFVIPRFELAADHDKMIFCCNLIGRENIDDLLKQMDGIHFNDSAKKQKQSKPSILKRIDQPDQKIWAKHVSQILADEHVQKVVLARKTTLSFKEFSNPWGMLRQLKAVTPNSYHFAFQFGPTIFLGASPERLYRRYQGLIESEALAGTMPKSAQPKKLLASVKNQHEHSFVVNDIDRSFKIFAEAYERDQKAGVLTLANGHHLITRFKGQLKQGVSDADILKLLHPTPALGGSPKTPAMNIIRHKERFSRGWYGAPVGYVGLDWAEFVVAIRSGLVKDKKLSVFAGAGIVEGSQAESEWNEIENKISNFLKITTT